MSSALGLSAGEKLRLARGGAGRRGVYTIGKGLEDVGAVRVQRRGDVEVVFAGEAYAVRPVQRGWHLALLAEDGTAIARYAPDRKRRGTITTPTGDELVLDFPRSRDRIGSLRRAGSCVADVRVQNGVVLAELAEPLDPLVVVFLTTIVLLRGGYEEPDHAPRPQWEPSRSGWWSTGLLGFGLFATGAHARDDGGLYDTADSGGSGDFDAGGFTTES